MSSLSDYEDEEEPDIMSSDTSTSKTDGPEPTITVTVGGFSADVVRQKVEPLVAKLIEEGWETRDYYGKGEKVTVLSLLAKYLHGKERDEARASLAGCRDSAVTLRREIERLEGEKDGLRMELKREKEQARDLYGRLDSYKKEFAVLADQVVNRASTIADLQKDPARLTGERDRANGQVDAQAQTIARQADEINLLNKRDVEATQAIAAHERRNVELQNRLHTVGEEAILWAAQLIADKGYRLAAEVIALAIPEWQVQS
jgi:hypothetical protein